MEKSFICAHYIEKLFSILNGVLSGLTGLNFFGNDNFKCEHIVCKGRIF